VEHQEIAELAVKQDQDYSSVQLYLDNDGAIQMFGYDSGPGVQAFFCKDDYECWVTVPPAAVGRLAFALLKEKFTGNLSAVHDLRDFCHDIEYLAKAGAGSEAVARAPMAAARCRGDPDAPAALAESFSCSHAVYQWQRTMSFGRDETASSNPSAPYRGATNWRSRYVIDSLAAS